MTFDKKTILLVDDDLAMRKMIKMYLELKGFAVLAVGNGEEGVEVFTASQGAIDLLVTDLYMPKMTGIELYVEICRTRPDLPVVFMTGGISTPELEELLTGEHACLLSKPFTPRDLLVRLHDLWGE
jgi:two-component system cell cycle sensor histidine kinase/response regulator CckA